MPVHDWTRVSDGTFHAFHVSWIAELQGALNRGILPPDYYAQAEQIIRPMTPDVLTLRTTVLNGDAGHSNGGGVALAIEKPKVRFTEEVAFESSTDRRRTLVIRHASGDRIVGLIEIMSPGNKKSNVEFERFFWKVIDSVSSGYHVLIIDLFPPTTRDPNGIHDAIWRELASTPFQQPEDSPLTLVSYAAGNPTRAFIEPTAIGSQLIDMPFFLESEHYINVPLESTYLDAFADAPKRWRDVLERA